MIDKIIISSDKRQATIFFTNREPFNLYSDNNQVLVLLDFILAPLGHDSLIIYNSILETTKEVTQEIYIDDIKNTA